MTLKGCIRNFCANSQDAPTGEDDDNILADFHMFCICMLTTYTEIYQTSRNQLSWATNNTATTEEDNNNDYTQETPAQEDNANDDM